MGVGRFFCVALPFILSVTSFIFLLIACLGGVTNKDLYMFRVNTTDFQLDPRDVIDQLRGGAWKDLLPDVDLKDVDLDKIELPDINLPDIEIPKIGSRDDSLLDKVEDAASNALQGRNITAKDVGLDNIYDIGLWGFCQTDRDGDRECTKPQFDWAEEHLNTSFIQTVGEISGGAIELPDEIETALETFKTVSKWTQVAYIISFVSLALAIIFGIFANCTRVMSCVTFIVAWIASVAVVGAASLSTAMSTVVVGTVEGSAKVYGVRANFNTTFLVLVWISAAAAIGAGFFWLFTICCCAPNHSGRKSRRRGSSDDEKLISPNGSSAYQPLGSPAHQGFYNQQTASQYGAPRYPSGSRDMAYEPYSHRG